ncbi:hypothetical protein GE061_012476 [Apolygus lucorum]|uniref:Nuclease HARBI1 n=1 Tax=Apolygus lucorum TaxID=248454 RepID=A0A6A4JBB0_APOLU|nr:hypothetical protein GE061_012476 [Apolygus lucorum]
MNRLFPIFSSSSSSSESDEDFQQLLEVVVPRRRIERERVDHFNIWDDTDFFATFQLTKEGISVILDLIENSLLFRTERNDVTSPALQLLTTMRYYATGSFLATAGDFSGVSKVTASRCIWRVTEALAACSQTIEVLLSTTSGPCQ